MSQRMKMIYRTITEKLLKSSTQYPVIALTGPRQSGKTTLVRSTFVNYTYVSLENDDVRQFADQDPIKFLDTYGSGEGIIIDEIQHVPKLLSYIQTIVDEDKRFGRFIITGSQNFLVNEAVTQSLAGRVALLTLFPFSIEELKNASLLPTILEEALFKGSYPGAYVNEHSPHELYTNYIRTYVERDVRTIKNVQNLSMFQNFMKLCAGRAGQVLNISSLANDCGIDHKTAHGWISLLEASYVLFLVYPYHKKFGKRVTKAPKLYFTDTGMVCALLRIRSAEELSSSYLLGSLFENLIIADLFKQYYNQGITPSIYFWRDQRHELDCIIDEPRGPFAIEIKSGATVTNNYFSQLTYWAGLSGAPSFNNFVVYGGSENQIRTAANVVAWKDSGTLVSRFI